MVPCDPFSPACCSLQEAWLCWSKDDQNHWEPPMVVWDELLWRMAKVQRFSWPIAWRSSKLLDKIHCLTALSPPSVPASWLHSSALNSRSKIFFRPRDSPELHWFTCPEIMASRYPLRFSMFLSLLPKCHSDSCNPSNQWYYIGVVNFRLNLRWWCGCLGSYKVWRRSSVGKAGWWHFISHLAGRCWSFLQFMKGCWSRSFNDK